MTCRRNTRLFLNRIYAWPRKCVGTVVTSLVGLLNQMSIDIGNVSNEVGRVSSNVSNDVRRVDSA